MFTPLLLLNDQNIKVLLVSGLLAFADLFFLL